MSKVYEFEAVMKKAEKVDGAYVEFPYNVFEEFGTNGRVMVKATFDGYEYKGILVKMGSDCHIIGITKAIRTAIKKQPDDLIKVTIQQDNSSRVDETPEDLEKALETNQEAKTFFESLTDSQKNKYIRNITSAKKEETRAARVTKSIEMLANKQK